MGVPGGVEMAAPPPPQGGPPPGPYPSQGVPVYPAPQPFPGVQMKPPIVPPQPGMVILAYQLDEPNTGCCQCDGLNATGWIMIILGLLIFWPLCFVVCFIPEFFDKYQRPVYGFPTAPPPMPMGAPPPKY